MKKIAVSVPLVCLILVFMLNAAACKLPSQSNADWVLRLVQQDIEKEMKSLDRDLAAAAQKLSGLDLTGAQARSILNGLLLNRSYAVDACTINRNGKILALEPAAYHEFEGSDISQQEQVIRLFRTQKAVLSQNFRTVEGFEAADLEHPVFSADKQIACSVSVLLKPEIMLGEIVSRTIEGTTFSVMLMQPDGRVIYDADDKEIGKNTFLDPLYQSYPQLLALAEKVSAKTSGTGHYEFLNTGLNTNVQKEAIWVTFALNGAEWRIVLISTVS
jgi:branched-chain amino acid transport system substrate-binding protein